MKTKTLGFIVYYILYYYDHFLIVLGDIKAFISNETSDIGEFLYRDILGISNFESIGLQLLEGELLLEKLEHLLNIDKQCEFTSLKDELKSSEFEQLSFLAIDKEMSNFIDLYNEYRKYFVDTYIVKNSLLLNSSLEFEYIPKDMQFEFLKRLNLLEIENEEYMDKEIMKQRENGTEMIEDIGFNSVEREQKKVNLKIPMNLIKNSQNTKLNTLLSKAKTLSREIMISQDISNKKEYIKPKSVYLLSYDNTYYIDGEQLRKVISNLEKLLLHFYKQVQQENCKQIAWLLVADKKTMSYIGKLLMRLLEDLKKIIFHSIVDILPEMDIYNESMIQIYTLNINVNGLLNTIESLETGKSTSFVFFEDFNRDIGKMLTIRARALSSLKIWVDNNRTELELIYFWLKNACNVMNSITISLIKSVFAFYIRNIGDSILTFQSIKNELATTKSLDSSDDKDKINEVLIETFKNASYLYPSTLLKSLDQKVGLLNNSENYNLELNSLLKILEARLESTINKYEYFCKLFTKYIFDDRLSLDYLKKFISSIVSVMEELKMSNGIPEIVIFYSQVNEDVQNLDMKNKKILQHPSPHRIKYINNLDINSEYKLKLVKLSTMKLIDKTFHSIEFRDLVPIQNTVMNIRKFNKLIIPDILYQLETFGRILTTFYMEGVLDNELIEHTKNFKYNSIYLNKCDGEITNLRYLKARISKKYSQVATSVWEKEKQMFNLTEQDESMKNLNIKSPSQFFNSDYVLQKCYSLIPKLDTSYSYSPKLGDIHKEINKMKSQLDLYLKDINSISSKYNKILNISKLNNTIESYLDQLKNQLKIKCREKKPRKGLGRSVSIINLIFQKKRKSSKCIELSQVLEDTSLNINNIIKQADELVNNNLDILRQCQNTQDISVSLYALFSKHSILSNIIKNIAQSVSSEIIIDIKQSIDKALQETKYLKDEIECFNKLDGMPIIEKMIKKLNNQIKVAKSGIGEEITNFIQLKV
ncbi:uncharacterized protein CMU_003400 [Cryptosporidium muris RN66]|uniref:Uncharacterized protein n=1 Tax=Cryptosporidium muris (strain RN66) TaxID=441375 RepID=B6AJW9_CRYMR|nr:uncharacterized protein CMU_003400 [Cryptosporidium muris RN66]EEA08510.1 hypothetical protein CMU_003400 [Cryptosporidium muris RN66]|eukprot:XP_002142859.1 hypothetical protein [Cryptosporidium muris RN66]